MYKFVFEICGEVINGCADKETIDYLATLGKITYIKEVR